MVFLGHISLALTVFDQRVNTFLPAASAGWVCLLAFRPSLVVRRLVLLLWPCLRTAAAKVRPVLRHVPVTVCSQPDAKVTQAISVASRPERQRGYTVSQRDRVAR